MAKQRIALLFGGTSTEGHKYLATVRSAAEVLSNNQYEVVLLGITPKGKWLYCPGEISSLQQEEWMKHPDCCPVVFNMDGTKQGIYKILEDQSLSFLHLDCVIPLLYGRGAVDGKVQGLLDLAGIPYVGNGTCPAAVSMDRAFTHMIASSAGIATAQYLTVKRTDKLDVHQLSEEVLDTFGYPVFVKPVGSLSGVSLAENEEDLAEAIKTAFTHDDKVLIEERILGAQIKCAVIGNDLPEASMLGEYSLEMAGDDFERKPSECVIPARLSQELSYQIRDLAIKTYQLFDCSGLAAVDFFITPAGEIYLNQVKTIPDLSADSLFVKLWEAVGVSYEDLLQRLISLAQERAETIK